MTESVKLLLVGDVGSGKRSLLLRWATGDYVENGHEQATSSGGLFSQSKVLDIGGHNITVEVADFGGEEEFRAITASSYRGCQGFVLVFDKNNKESVDSLESWSRDIQYQAGKKGFSVVVAAAKCDAEGTRGNIEKGQEQAEKLGVKFFETSAKTGENVNECINALLQDIMSSKEEYDDDLEMPSLSTTKGKKKKDCIIC